MPAYATQKREQSARSLRLATESLRCGSDPKGSASQDRVDAVPDVALIDQLVDVLAEKVAAAIAQRMGSRDENADEWFDSRHAAEYLGIHRDTLRKLAAERAIPSEQDGPGCKLYFRRGDLDAWRRSGGRPQHLLSSLDLAA